MNFNKDTIQKILSTRLIEIYTMIIGCMGLLQGISFYRVRRDIDNLINTFDFDGLMSSFRFFSTTYRINIILLTLVLIGLVVKMIVTKSKDSTLMMAIGGYAAAWLSSLVNSIAVSNLAKIFNSEEGIFGLLDSSGYQINAAFVYIMIIIQIIMGILAALAFFNVIKSAPSQETVSAGGNVTKAVAGNNNSTQSLKMPPIPNATGTVKSENTEKTDNSEKTEKNVMIQNNILNSIKQKPKLFGGIALGILLVLGLGMFLFNQLSKTTVDINKICPVSFSGYDGAGTATCACAYGDPALTDKQNDVIRSITFTFDSKNGKYSNGDTATVTAQYDKKQADAADLKIKNSEVEIEVSGLDAVYKTFDSIAKEDQEELQKIAERGLVNNSNQYSFYITDSFMDNFLDDYKLLGVYYGYEMGNGQAFYLYRVTVTHDRNGNNMRTNSGYVVVKIPNINPQKPISLDNYLNSVRVDVITAENDAEAIEECERTYKNVSNFTKVSGAKTESSKEEKEEVKEEDKDSDKETKEEKKDGQGYSVEYISIDEAISFFEEGKTGLLFFQYQTSKCPWCIEAKPVLEEAAKNEDVTIYMVNTRDENNNLLYNEAQKAKFEKYFPNYLELEENGYVLYVPLVLAVKDGTVVDGRRSTFDDHDATTRQMTEEERAELLRIYTGIIQKMK